MTGDPINGRAPRPGTFSCRPALAVVAEDLHLSKRTIDNHLGRIYGKLDMGGRDDLPAVFAGLD